MAQIKKELKYSIVIPVYNSADIVEKTIRRTVEVCQSQGWNYELILVNDGSQDQSWEILRRQASLNPHIIAINLLRNYGQHSALFCGLQKSRGDYVITLDDDLQNPPEEIHHLIQKIHDGHDVVYGRFRSKKHPLYRRLGSLLIGAVNKRIFYQPAHIVPTNFRLIHRDVVERICTYQAHYPYITGLTLMFSSNPGNVWVAHQERAAGKSTYSLRKIVELVMRILFNYSSFPLRLTSVFGLIVSSLGFLMGAYFIAKSLFFGVSVPGWTTVVVLLSFFHGLTVFILSMLGEYTIRLLKQTSHTSAYQIKEILGPHV